MSIFFGDGKGEYDDLLNKLVTQTINPSHVYETVYDALMKNKSYALYGEYPKDLKIKAIDSMVKWFELTEEYEKCIELKKIKDKI
tara:strand:+ start:21 stop:275 length:255 start_codon:yes stop_codon:yes gene_type:complete